jgi:ribonuclease E
VVRQLRLRDIGGIIVVDFIDMVLESNRDLVLRRLTEALSRDRTRHQVSEVTSLGLVQLTRKKLGTGLIEAFSTNCTHCAGRGIVLHSDPVDSAPSAGRKSEPSGRRKRGKKGARPDDVQVATVPTHSHGEHPMFKAMAAAVRPEDDDEDEGLDDEAIDESTDASVDEPTEDVAELVTDEDSDESDSADDESDDVELDEDDEDAIEDDIVLIDEDSDDESDDDDDDEDDDESDDEDDDSDDDYDDSDDVDDDDDDSDDAPVEVARVGRQRRRAAARPAGPPAGVD